MAVGFRHVLDRLTCPGPAAGPGDADLLARFAATGDGGAFAALVGRHGPMVLGTCRRVLRHRQDAEDAFQATFLVLACKPAAVRPPGRVGAWLHGVALRVARRARRSAGRRAATEALAAAAHPRPVATADRPPDELREVIDEVLAGLPERYRAAVVLCDLEGLSRKVAAGRLGWPEGTLSGRLARAHRLLAARLARRGVAVVAGGVGAVLSASAAPAGVAGELATSTVRMAGLVADGLPVPAGLAALSGKVLTVMWWNTWKTPAAAGLAAGLLVAGLGSSGPSRATADPPAKASPAVAADAAKPPAKGWVTTQTLKRDRPVTVLAVGPDGVVAVGDDGGSVVLWEPKGGKDPRVVILGGAGDPPAASVDRLGFTPDGPFLYTITNGGRVIARTDLGKEQLSGGGFGGDDPRHLGFSADASAWLERSGKPSSFLIRGSMFTDPEASMKFESVELDADITHLAASADGQLVAAVTDGPAVRLIERDGGRTRWITAAPKLAAAAVRFSADGKLLAVVGENGFAAVYDAATGKESAKLKGLDGLVHAVAFSPDGKLVATGGQDQTARVWDAATGKQLAVLKGHADAVKDVAFGPAGKTLVTGSADKTVRVWEFKE